FFPYWGEPRERQHLLAFVVRPGKQPVARLDLGPMLPIREAIAAWRGKVAKGDPAGAEGTRLRRLIWEPLLPHLKGAQTGLASPDAELCLLPLAALPGDAADTLLIEERAIAVVPVPQMLLADRPKTGAAKDLLLVGDVDFEADPGAWSGSQPMVQGVGPSGRTPPPRFEPLPGTRGEMEQVALEFAALKSDGAVRRLQAPEATEGAFRKALSGCRYLHLATHGYYRPQASGAVPLALASPGLDAAVVLAGANRPRKPDRDDGLLTAVEA